jgi:hypothetical protein
MSLIFNAFINEKNIKKYEFGKKISIIYTQTTGVIIGAIGFLRLE